MFTFSLLLFLSLGLGLCIGSFLNVIIYRYGTGLSPFVGRSICPVCNKNLSWYELIPVFSFLIQKGRCRGCGTTISIQYIIVELISSILFVLVFIRQYNLYHLYSLLPHGLLYSILFVLFYWVIVSILLIIAVYDLRHQIIPNALVYVFSGISLCKLFLFSFICLNVSPFLFPYVFDLFAPIIFFIPFAFLWLISGGRWIGFGDAKLVVGIGALLGFVSGLSAIIIGFWVGAIVCLILMGIERIVPNIFGGLSAESQIPLGPFLVFGTLLVLFYQFDVFGITAYFAV